MFSAHPASGLAPTDKDSALRDGGPLFVSFSAGDTGVWRIDSIHPVKGESLPMANRLAMLESSHLQPMEYGTWTLRGVTTNGRYSTHDEVGTMRSKQRGLGRPQATRAALIPI